MLNKNENLYKHVPNKCINTLKKQQQQLINSDNNYQKQNKIINTNGNVNDVKKTVTKDCLNKVKNIGNNNINNKIISNNNNINNNNNNNNNNISVQSNKSNKVNTEEFKSVQTLKQFWNKHIEANSITTTTQTTLSDKDKRLSLNTKSINNYSKNIKGKSLTLDNKQIKQTQTPLLNDIEKNSGQVKRSSSSLITKNNNNNSNNNSINSKSDSLKNTINDKNIKNNCNNKIVPTTILKKQNENDKNKSSEKLKIDHRTNISKIPVITRSISNTSDSTNDFYKHKTADTVKKKRKTLQVQSIDYNLAFAQKRHSIDSYFTTKTTNDTNNKQQQQQQQKTQVQQVPQQKPQAIEQKQRTLLNNPIISMNLTGEKIHWAKRDEIFANVKNINLQDKKQQQQQQEQEQQQKTEQQKQEENILSECHNNININTINRNNSFNVDNKNLSNDNIEENKMVIKERERCNINSENNSNNNNNNIIKTEIKKEMDNNDKIVLTSSSPSTPMLIEKNYIIDNKNTINNNNMSPNCNNDNSNNNNIDIDIDSDVINLLQTNELPRKTLVSSTTRKLSFKTHPRSGGHFHHRKMVINHSGSKVAALTQRFNQLINEDSGILDEIKKKGVLHKTPSCVYKIRAEGDQIKRKSVKRTDDTSDDCSSIKFINKRRGSVKRKESEKNRPISCVKAAIEIFEPKIIDVKVNIEPSKINSKLVKPKVPTKSEEVLLKTKEIAFRNNQRKLNAINSIIKESEGLEVLCNSNPNVTIIEIPQNELANISEQPHLDLIEIKEPEIKFDLIVNNEKEIVNYNETQEENVNWIVEPNIDEERNPIDLVVPNEIEIESDNNRNEINLYRKEQPTSIEEVLSYAVDDIPPIKEKSKSIFKKWKVMESGEKIYERMRLKFTHKKAPSEKQIQKSMTKRQQEIDQENGNSSNPDQKIVDALCDVTQKIEHLSKSENNLSIQETYHRESLLPNDSFLFRSSSKTSFGSTSEIQHTSSIVEAINTAVISKTQSMDETRFPTSSHFMREMLHSDTDENELSTIFKETGELISKLLRDYDENDYEFITRPKKTDELVEEKLQKDEEEEEIFEEYDNSEQEAPVFIENIYETPKRKPKTLKEDIYQSIAEVKASMMENNDDDNNSGYESFDNYESVTIIKNKTKKENGYEILCDPPEPPPPRKGDSTQSLNTSINNLSNLNSNNINNNNNKNRTPALPVPKRSNFYDTQNGDELPSYEKIKYDKTPPRPPKSLIRFPTEYSHQLFEIQELPIRKKEKDYDDDIDDDTYESIRHKKDEMKIQKAQQLLQLQHNFQQQPDTISLTSNCYESISSIGRQDFIRSELNQNLKHSDSMSTLSSEHKTNSLYGTTMGQSITPPSEGSSDEWIDISDNEDDKSKRYIVYRQRTKCHRSPEWSSRVRKRIKQQDDDDINEVFISSQSFVYLTGKNAEFGTVEKLPEPVYQNTTINNYCRRDQVKFGYLQYERGFCTCRLIEVDENIIETSAIKNSNDIHVNDCNDVDVVDNEERDLNNKKSVVESQLISVYIDDSDHHYESLYSTKYPEKQEQNKQQQQQSQNKQILRELPEPNLPIAITTSYADIKPTRPSPAIPFKTIYDERNNQKINNNNQHHQHYHQNHHHHHLNQRLHNDDAASDTFSEGETDEDVKKNDSGVDISLSQTRLPDLPPSPIYGLFKSLNKIKSFKKSFSKITKKTTKSTNDLKQQKSEQIYEDSKTYAFKHEYQNTNFDGQNQKSAIIPTAATSTNKKLSSIKSLKKLSLSPRTIHDPYENTEFHTPRTPTSASINFPTSPKLSDSSMINGNNNNNNRGSGTIYDSQIDINNDKNNLLRNKKSTKSLKNNKQKLKKTDSNLSIETSTLPQPQQQQQSTPQMTQSTFYISDSCEPDSGIFSGSNDKIQITDDKESININSQTIIDDMNNKNILTVETYSTQKIKAPPRRKHKFFHSPELNRRKTTIGVRPNDPPPPPPTSLSTTILKQKKPASTWYTECGVFKTDTLIEDSNVLKSRQRNSTASWYADAGVYQTSNNSVASSSGSSGVSTGGEGGPGDDNSHSMFFNEPLYQIYSAAKLESISRDIEMEHEEENGYEEVGRNKPLPPEEEKKNLRPSALQLVGPRQGPSRTLWSEIPEVINSGILGTLTQTERRLQEAKFEILTSEASYLKSLNLLKSHFMHHPAFRDPKNLSPENRKCLFSCILPVLDCSDRLLCDLESCWQDNIMLLGLSYSIYKHAEKSFHVYISYCEHQGKLDRTLKKLKEEKSSFREALDLLELSEICYGLSLHSFLMLPMQRITRLPLLIDAVLTKLDPTDDEFKSWERTLLYLNKIVRQCNEAANRCEQAYEIKAISQSIEFPHTLIPIPIIPVGPGSLPRTLIRRGELTHLIWRNDDGKLTFGKRFTKCSAYAFLFTDLLVLTRKKSDETYIVTDYCQRSMLTVSSGDVIPQLPTKDIPLAGKHLMLMTLLENHEKKTVEMIFSCSSETDRQRWLQATAPPSSDTPGETLYEQWDCPQVHAIHTYNSTQPDELSLEIGDILKVLRKMVDGWYHGERLRDGEQGWFPGNYTKEIASAHVYARNLKQRQRLLLLSASYLEAQKKV